MNKKIKFLSTSLSAFLLTSGMALTNVHAQSLNTNNTSKATVTYTANSSNKGYNYDVSKDVYDNIHVTIAPEDYQYHTYTVNVAFLDSNKGIMSRINEDDRALKYTHVFASQDDWKTAEVWIYADGDLIADQVVSS